MTRRTMYCGMCRSTVYADDIHSCYDFDAVGASDPREGARPFSSLHFPMTLTLDHQTRSIYVQDLLLAINDGLNRGDWDTARAAALTAVAASPYDAGVLTSYGALHELAEQYEDALALLILSLCEQPTNAAAWQNIAMITARGVALKNPHVLSLLAARLGADANPRAILPAYHVAKIYRGLGYPEQAGRWLREVGHRLDAYRTDQANLGAANVFNRAFMHLELGSVDADHWTIGFAAYEARLEAPSHQLHERALTRPVDAGPRWVSGPAPQTLAVFCEQGLGDSIMCLRYVQQLARDGHHVILEPHAPLVPLFRERLTDTTNITVIDHGAPLPVPVDSHVWAMSLPGKHWTGPTDIPAGTLRWDRQTAKYVAFCWQGSRAHRSDAVRSLPVEHLKPLAEAVRAKGLSPIALNPGEPTPDFLDAPPAIASMADTARLLDETAAVVAVDTALVHLAGTMGVPTIALLAAYPDWRWGLNDPAPHWYQSVRLARQATIGEWGPVVARASTLLDEILAS